MIPKKKKSKATSSNSQSKIVTLGLQLLSGERLISDFEPSVSLWDVLQHWQSENKLEPSLESCSNEIPLCIYLRQELCGKETLERKKLLDLGITGGKVIIRYLTRQAGALKEQAHVGGILAPPPKPLIQETTIISMKEEDDKELLPQIKSMDADVEPNKADAVKEDLCKEEMDVVSDTMDTEDLPVSKCHFGELEIKSVSAPKEEPSLDIDYSTLQAEQQYVYDKGTLDLISERGELIYHIDDSSSSNLVTSADQDLSDDFFDLTVDDLRNLMRDLRKQCSNMQNEPLLTAEQRLARKEQRQQELLQKYPITVIRIQFRDRLVLQIPFDSETKLSEVKQQLLNYLEMPCEEKDFYLYTSPPKSILDPSLSLLAAGLSPSSVLHIGSSSTVCQLKDEYRSRLSSPSAAMIEAAQRILPKLKQEPTEPIQLSTLESISSSVDESRNQIPKRPSSSSSKTVPKWFKMNK